MTYNNLQPTDSNFMKPLYVRNSLMEGLNILKKL